MSAANLQAREPIQRPFENQVREKHRRLERIADRVAQTALPLQSRILRRAGSLLRVHEQHDTQLFGFRPERIEPAIGELLALDAAADRGAPQSELSDGLIELVGGHVGVLQRQRGHSHESIGILGHRRCDAFVLHGDEIAGELALGRIAPGVDIDRLDIDPLLVHVLQALRGARAERDRSGEIVL